MYCLFSIKKNIYSFSPSNLAHFNEHFDGWSFICICLRLFINFVFVFLFVFSILIFLILVICILHIVKNDLVCKLLYCLYRLLLLLLVASKIIGCSLNLINKPNSIWTPDQLLWYICIHCMGCVHAALIQCSRKITINILTIIIILLSTTIFIDKSLDAVLLGYFKSFAINTRAQPDKTKMFVGMTNIVIIIWFRNFSYRSLQQQNPQHLSQTTFQSRLK